jgi:hypothetical protein
LGSNLGIVNTTTLQDECDVVGGHAKGISLGFQGEDIVLVRDGKGGDIGPEFNCEFNAIELRLRSGGCSGLKFKKTNN